MALNSNERLANTFPMNINQKAPILKLPVEVLQLILEFVPACDRVLFLDENGRLRDHAQVLVLRQVCRLFRIISNGLRVWHDDDFDFSSLLPHETRGQLRAFREGKLLRALFNDDHFVVRLSQKRCWTFSTLESVFAVLYGVQHFHYNARMLNLELVEGCEIALRRLSVCRDVVDVFLFLDGSVIDLDVFATSFPALQNLFLFGLGDYIGSLNALSSLHSLYLLVDFYTSDYDISLVPISSAATFTRLSITSQYSFKSAMFGFNPLDILYNLNNLSFEPLDNTFAEFMVNTATQLTSLVVSLRDYIPLELIEDVMSSRCLSRLESFTLTVPEYLMSVIYEEDVLEYGVPIVDAITLNLSSVRDLKFIMGLHLGLSSYFSRLKNLKSLKWTIIEGNYNARKELGDDDLIEKEEGDPMVAAERAFERAFTDFEEKPVFSFEFR